jgi:hypothetical protein
MRAEGTMYSFLEIQSLDRQGNWRKLPSEEKEDQREVRLERL